MNLSITPDLKDLLVTLKDAYLVYEWPLETYLGNKPNKIEIEVFQREEEVKRIVNSLGYETIISANSPFILIHPSLGEVVIYTTNHYDVYIANKQRGLIYSAYNKGFNVLSLIVDKEGTIHDYVNALPEIDRRLLKSIGSIHKPIKVLAIARLISKLRLNIAEGVSWNTNKCLPSFCNIYSWDIWKEVEAVSREVLDINEYLNTLITLGWKNTIFDLTKFKQDIITCDNPLFNLVTLVYFCNFNIENNKIPSNIRRKVNSMIDGVVTLTSSKEDYNINRLAKQLLKDSEGINLKLVFDYMQLVGLNNPNSYSHDYPVECLINGKDLENMGWKLVNAVKNNFLKQALIMQLANNYNREQLLDIFKNRLISGHYLATGKNIRNIS